MISTVTTATVSTLTLAGSFAMLGIVMLLGLLVQKEISANSDNKRAKRLAKALNIAIVPLLIVFALIVASKVIQVLR